MRSIQRSLIGTALAAALLFACGLQAAPASTSLGEQWMNNYYKNPAPQEFASAFQHLSDSGYLDQPANVPLAIGFVASVFAQNPDRVDRWMDQGRSLPLAHQRVLASALWYSGNPKGAGYMRDYARDCSPALRSEILARLNTAPDLNQTEVLSASSLNLQWGAFLATGENAPVRNILAALALNNNSKLSQDVRWSLAQNAAQHQRVLAICRDELSRQPNAVRETLRAVINDSETRNPSS